MIDSTVSVIVASPAVTVDPVVPIDTTDESTQTSPINIVISTISDSPGTPVHLLSRGPHELPQCPALLCLPHKPDS